MLAVHGVVEPVPGVYVPSQVLQLVTVGRQDSLKRVAEYREQREVGGPACAGREFEECAAGPPCRDACESVESACPSARVFTFGESWQKEERK